LRHDREIAPGALANIGARFGSTTKLAQLRQTAGLRPVGSGEPATAACSLRLEHAPTVLARVDSQIGFLKNESNVMAPELLARTAAERSIASGDALAHLAGKPIGRE
jgi:hypothetical protein